MSEYWLLFDYGPEGWHVESKHDNLLDAVTAREANYSNPVTKVIVENIEILEAYRRADYERERRNREREPKP